MSTTASAGYSGTPLAKKLGLKAGQRIWLADAPPGYLDLVAPLPPGVVFEAKPHAQTDLAHVFVTDEARLRALLKRLRTTLGPQAVLWVSWPKKSSQRPTTVTEDTVRALALPLGWVDVKVCAVDDTWSGLKLVVRRELR
jgi:hypothetical protein